MTAPLPADYHLELDTSKELDPVRAKYYQSQIGILRWAVELGRVDIITEVSTLASHLVLPREGHLDALFQIYAYLKKRHNSPIVLDPTYLNEPQGEFIECDWREFYGNVKEPIPPNAPRPLGKEVELRLYTDSSHAGDYIHFLILMHEVNPSTTIPPTTIGLNQSHPGDYPPCGLYFDFLQCPFFSPLELVMPFREVELD